MNVFAVLLMVSLQVWNSNAVGCDTVYVAVPTFKNCAYRCHCTNDDPCDVTTGECSNGCDPGWAGPACQYRDSTKDHIAVNHIGQSTGSSNAAENAVDRDINTCSMSQITPNANTYNYWYIELKRAYLINGLRINIPADNMGAFRSFSVLLSMDGTQYNTVCYQHTPRAVDSDIDIGCTDIVLARFVKIILGTPDTAIALCEVYVFSGRDLAFNKKTNSTNGSPDRPVNGQGYASTISFYSVCLATKGMNTWWILDFGGNYVIQDIYYGGRTDCCIYEQIKGFIVHIRADVGISWLTIYTDAYIGNDQHHYYPLEISLSRTYSVSFLRLSRSNPTTEHEKNNGFIVCDIKAFGECPDGLCGWECTDTCQCSTPPTGANRLNGTCPTGCKERYSGAAGSQRCDIVCDLSQWGPGCEKKCGNCHTAPCDVATGTCNGGCSGPWKPTLCIESCDDGWYGVNCSQPCGHCKDNNVCDKTSGICPTDVCEDGWVFGLCKEQCNAGKFGQNCAERCGQCSGIMSCFHVDGNCNSSCKPGYSGRTCHDQCPHGKYGTNCSQTCGNCLNDLPCNTVTGVCNGCVPGYNGTLCQTRCPNGTYGVSCTHKCGLCANSKPCDHVTGACTNGCIKWFEGTLCQVPVSQTLDKQDDRLGIGIGIGVGATLVVLAAVGVTAYICKRFRSLRSTQTNDSNYETTTRDGMDVAHVYDSL